VLAWKLDYLRPFDERVITYSVRPVMEVSGTLKLPKATIKYLDKKKIRKSSTQKTCYA
jgi:hypothetical protein